MKWLDVFLTARHLDHQELKFCSLEAYLKYAFPFSEHIFRPSININYMDKLSPLHSLHNSLWKNQTTQGHKDGPLLLTFRGKQLHLLLRVCLGIKLKTYLCTQRACGWITLPHTKVLFGLCYGDSLEINDTGWEGQERRGFWNVRDPLRLFTFPMTCQGAFLCGTGAGLSHR